MSQPNWPKDITWPRLIIDIVMQCSVFQPGEGKKSYKKNYSGFGTLGPAGVDVSDTNNYCHKAKKRFGSVCIEEKQEC